MDYEIAKSLFDYQDGFLVWKKSAGTIKTGKKVESVSNRGYVVVQVGGKRYLAHRIIWLLLNGQMPVMIDHIDGNKQNNLIENLREVDNTLNHWNERKRTTNKSGHKGVWWHKQSKRWEAACRVSGKQITIGRFERIEDAVEAVRKFREQQHGKYANNG
jgi:hypothetical protein